MPAGRRVAAPVDFTDIGGTCCDLAGVGGPAEAGGVRYAPALRREPFAGEPAVYTWGNFDRSSRRYKHPVQYVDELLDVVQTERWKLRSDGWLYDLRNDEFEERLVPVGADPAADVARRSLRAQLGTLRRSEPRRWGGGL